MAQAKCSVADVKLRRGKWKLIHQGHAFLPLDALVTKLSEIEPQFR